MALRATLHRSQALGGAPLSSPSGARERAHKSFRRRITRLERSRSSASTQRHLTSATEHERALTRRELALRAVAADRRRPTPTGTPNDRGTTRGFLLRRARSPCRGRLARRGHHLAPRPALVRATGAATEPCGRSSIAPHGVRLGGTMRVHMVRIVRAEMAAPFSGRSGQPRVDSTTTGHRCWSTRGYHAWTKRITGYWPPARRRTRTSGVAPSRTTPAACRMGRPTRRCSRSCDCSHDRPRVKSSTRPSRSRIVLSKRTANESRHLRPVLVGEPAGRIDR